MIVVLSWVASVIAYIGCECVDSPGEGTHGLFGGGVFVDGGGSESKRRAFCDQGGSGQVTQLVSEVYRGGH